MNNITIIIPIHQYTNETCNLLIDALKSVGDDKNVIISTVSEIATDLFNLINENNFTNNVTIITDDASENSKSDFATLVNYGVNNVTTDWFSILEFDDTYTNIWWDNVKKYIEYMPSCSVFLPLTELTEFGSNKFIGYGNEAPWATSFSNEVGYIDNDCLQEYFDFYLTGGVFNTKDWKNVGGLKPSIKLTFWYEFLLRLTNLNKKVYVIPKLGYKHYLNRPSSLYAIYNDTISEKEGNWWYELSRQEYFFKEDRNKVYTPIEDENNENNGDRI